MAIGPINPRNIDDVTPAKLDPAVIGMTSLVKNLQSLFASLKYEPGKGEPNALMRANFLFGMQDPLFDVIRTICPGSDLYENLESMRGCVNAYLHSISPSSPNGDEKLFNSMQSYCGYLLGKSLGDLKSGTSFENFPEALSLLVSDCQRKAASTLNPSNIDLVGQNAATTAGDLWLLSILEPPKPDLQPAIQAFLSSAETLMLYASEEPFPTDLIQQELADFQSDLNAFNNALPK